MSSQLSVLPKRLYSLDALRGIAALSVVIWHWQHFFYVGGSPQGFELTSQPLFTIFSLFYTYGSRAVELFFCISGFVFFWLFAKKISSGDMAVGDFFIDRFSRLYPLHIVTFLLAALLQLMYIRSHAGYFVYQFNDYYHALLNVFLAPAWGFEKGFSFNAPVWSVSTEVLLYAIFFGLCLTKKIRYVLVPCLILLGVYLYEDMPKLSVGLVTFFSGGTAFIVLDHSAKFLGTKKTLWASVALAAGVWAYVWQTPVSNSFILTGIAFPASIAALAALELVKPGFAKPLSFLGDISYSSYLVHFPLQIIFAMVVDMLGFQRAIFYNVWMLVLFTAVLVPLSFISHRMLEVPSQRHIRALYMRRRLRHLRVTD
ncbi:acyltransferase [Pseudomonas graminis]|uniref:acyltransferase family protein n=1 Tax=Pseudomonas graminis TaxID=158627 RepID=UPI00234B31CF|nr:acyltransferase [Pseudomonas graminis]MDC6380328.1 acyltransferase [Pseudomonas graminis]